MPAVIFTDPQVATVGSTKPRPSSKASASMPRAGPGKRAACAGEFDTGGFIKLVAKTRAGRAGVQAAGEAGELSRRR